MSDTSTTGAEPASPPATVTPAPASQASSSDMPWWVLPGLAFLLLLSLDTVVAVAFITNDATLKPVLATGLLNLATGALSYYFGSSASSRKKDDTTAELGRALAVSTPVEKK